MKEIITDILLYVSKGCPGRADDAPSEVTIVDITLRPSEHKPGMPALHFLTDEGPHLILESVRKGPMEKFYALFTPEVKQEFFPFVYKGSMDISKMEKRVLEIYKQIASRGA